MIVGESYLRRATSRGDGGEYSYACVKGFIKNFIANAEIDVIKRFFPERECLGCERELVELRTIVAREVEPNGRFIREDEMRLVCSGEVFHRADGHIRQPFEIRFRIAHRREMRGLHELQFSILDVECAIDREREGIAIRCLTIDAIAIFIDVDIVTPDDDPRDDGVLHDLDDECRGGLLCEGDTCDVGAHRLHRLRQRGGVEEEDIFTECLLAREEINLREWQIE